MTTYLGAMSHGAHTIIIRRLGKHINWLLTTQARACLTAALHPTPTRPLDGQEPLIGES